MVTTTLSKRPERIIAEFLVTKWDSTNTYGFDPNITDESAEGFCPLVTHIDNVGTTYPHITVRFSSETTPNETTYDALTSNGPAQVRNGQVLATARAEDRPDIGGYVGDSQSYSQVDSSTLVATLCAEVERICIENFRGPEPFGYLGSQNGPDVPDDVDDSSRAVRLAQRQVSYNWLRAPPQS